MHRKIINQKTYDQNADAMAKEFNSAGARIEDIERGFSFAGKRNPFVLEIGCGNGRDAKEILLRTNNYIGIDSSVSMIKLAKQSAPDGRFITIDAEDFEFLNLEPIDIIFAFASFLHFDGEALKAIFNRAYNSIVDGGIIYISLKYGEYREFIKDDKYGQRIFYYYTPEDIKQLAGQHYFTVHEEKYILRGQHWFSIILKKKNERRK